MEIRLTHPRHGATHAYDETQLKFLTDQGWAPECAPSLPPNEVISARLAEIIPRKPGRPKKVKE